MAVLEYHTGDLFENPDALGRLEYYGIYSYPTARFNGTREISGGWRGVYGYYEEAYHTEMQNHPSFCSLNALLDYDSETRFLKVKSTVVAINGFENAYLHYVIAENHIYHPWEDLDSLHHVVRQMLPDYNGVALPTMNPNDTYIDSQTCTLNPEWNHRNCYLVIFVQQDDSDKPVLRSTKIGPLFWISGDANGDGCVYVTDLVHLINYLFKKGPAADPLASADLNNDCTVDLFDIIYLVNYLFKLGPAPMKGCAW